MSIDTLEHVFDLSTTLKNALLKVNLRRHFVAHPQSNNSFGRGFCAWAIVCCLEQDWMNLTLNGLGFLAPTFHPILLFDKVEENRFK